MVNASARTTYKMNKKPWAYPMYLLGSPSPAKYFKGILIAKSIRKEIPSRIAVSLKVINMLFRGFIGLKVCVMAYKRINP